MRKTDFNTEVEANAPIPDAPARWAIEPVTALDEVVPLLNACGLDASDLAETALPDFFGVRQAGSLVALVGLERWGPVGLLRSLAVLPALRGRGIGLQLLSHAEAVARSKGVQTLYLLTTTAAALFARQGYVAAARTAAPEVVRNTPQFAGLCPASSAFMMKVLDDFAIC